MIKLIASDLDGTLLQNGAQSLPPELFSIIAKLKAKGIHFVAASGRQYINMTHLFEAVKEDISFISENGGMYVLNGDIVIPQYHTKELTEELITTIRQDSDCELTYSCAHTTYVEPKSQYFVDHLQNLLAYHTTITKDVLSVDAPAMKISICNANGTKESAPKYKTLFSDKVSVITSGDLWVDFMPFGVNKGAALKKLIQNLDIKPEECMAFGDQWNDAEMLQLVGTSYAMANAVPGIADLCTHTTDSVIKELQNLLHNLEL